MEKYEGIRRSPDMTLEDRWNALMDETPAQLAA